MFAESRFKISSCEVVGCCILRVEVSLKVSDARVYIIVIGREKVIIYSHRVLGLHSFQLLLRYPPICMRYNVRAAHGLFAQRYAICTQQLGEMEQLVDRLHESDAVKPEDDPDLCRPLKWKRRGLKFLHFHLELRVVLD